MTRVVLTGLGVISSIGIGAGEFAAGLRAGRSGARPISVFDTTGFAHATGCEVVDFEPRQWIRTLDVSLLGPATRFAAAAAWMAVADALLDEAELRDRRGVVSIGTTDGESRDLDELVEAELRSGPSAMDPLVAGRVGAESFNQN